MKAVLISVNYETDEVMTTFHEGENPILTLKGLWESIKDDWPGWESMVTGDAEATKVWAKYVTDQMLGKERS